MGLFVVTFWIGFNLRAAILGVPPVLSVVKGDLQLSYTEVGLLSGIRCHCVNFSKPTAVAPLAGFLPHWWVRFWPHREPPAPKRWSYVHSPGAR